MSSILCSESLIRVLRVRVLDINKIIFFWFFLFSIVCVCKCGMDGGCRVGCAMHAHVVLEVQACIPTKKPQGKRRQELK